MKMGPSEKIALTCMWAGSALIVIWLVARAL